MTEDRLGYANDEDGVWLVCPVHGWYRPDVSHEERDWWSPTPTEALTMQAQHRREHHREGKPMRLCLNMIVKDEAANIERCLNSVASFIDCFSITDTGSTDNTVNLIWDLMAAHGIPGEVHTEPFIDFSQARNAALQHALKNETLEFDYLLLCDADMELRTNGGFPDLTAGAYMITQYATGVEYPNLRLVHRDTPAVYRGVTHEYLDVGNVDRPLLEGVWFIDYADGGNREGKAERDIELLLPTAETDPRSCFYLANTYYDAGMLDEAYEWYAIRLSMGGYDEERFYSSYRMGQLDFTPPGDEDRGITRLLRTFDSWPHRAEPLHTLAMHYQSLQQWHLSEMMAETGARIPLPAGGLFVEGEVYQWRLLDAWAVAAWWTGNRDLAGELNRGLLDLAPPGEHDRIQGNLEHTGS